MNKLRKNIISVILAVLIMLTGNFSYAVTHLDCEIDDDMHRTCEMECCSENACSDSEAIENTINLTKDKRCCEIHEDSSIESDYSFPPANQTIEKIKIENIFANIASANVVTPYHFTLITHKLKSTNIYLAISNLRI